MRKKEPRTLRKLMDAVQINKVRTEISEDEKFIIRCMIEVKPDIAVIYKNKEQKYLLKEIPICDFLL